MVLEQIINLYKNMNEVYHSMRILEMNGLIKSDGFLLLVNMLKEMIVREKSLFSKFINDYKDVYDKVFDDICRDVDDYEDYVSRRLYNYMNNYNKSNSIDYFDEEDMEEIEDGFIEKLDLLYNFCSKNLNLIYLSFLSDYIDSLAFKDIKDAIIGYKYYYSITDHDMEDVLVNNSFDVSKINYVDLDLMGLSLGIDFFLSDEIRRMIYFNAIDTSIKELLMISNDGYKEDFKKANAIKCQCMIRAALLLLNDDWDGYNMKIDSINKILEESIDLSNSVSVDIIKSLIKCVDKDKYRIRKISVRQSK